MHSKVIRNYPKRYIILKKCGRMSWEKPHQPNVIYRCFLWQFEYRCIIL